MGRVTEATRIRTVRVREGRLYAGRKGDRVAVEEPLDIRLNGQQLSLTMRTPGHDVELIHGFLHGEGLIAHRTDISEARYCDGAVVDDGTGVAQNTYNVMDFTTARPQLLPLVSRNFSAGGLRGVRRREHRRGAAEVPPLAGERLADRSPRRPCGRARPR